jgi:NADH-quinone oxidoreductase subunit M
MREHLLTIVLAIPALGALACLFVPRDRPGAVRAISMAAALVGFGLSFPLWRWFARGTADYQFVEERSWIPQIGAAYRLGIDGIALLLLLLTLLVLPLVLAFSWRSITDRVKEYHVFLLLLQVGMLGVFCALDVLLFFVFWEIMLVPMYFLIGIWGSENRRYAAIKFFLYTAAGSALMLLALLKLYFANGQSFDLRSMADLALDPVTQTWVFLGLFLGFAIKVPLFPLHTWLPDAHGQAPTAGSVVLAAVLLKMGTYGFVRFAIPILPEATIAWMPLLLLLCVVGIIYGALTAMAQKDMKQLVAYSSVSHLGFVMLGVFCLNPNGLSGGLLQMLNHGLSTGALFMLVGMLYERRHTKLIESFGGIAKPMPLFAATFVIVTMSSIGLPGLNGFVGEFTILAGTVELAVGDWSRLIVVILAATGIVLGAVYMLWMVKRVFFGPLTHAENEKLADVRPFGLEFWSVAPLVAVCFWIGIYPKPFFEILDPPVRHLVEITRPGYYDAPLLADVTAGVPGRADGPLAGPGHARAPEGAFHGTPERP